MLSVTLAHHPHATPKPTVAGRPHGHKEAAPQVLPMNNVMLGESPFVTRDQFQSATSRFKTASDVVINIIDRTMVKSSCALDALSDSPSFSRLTEKLDAVGVSLCTEAASYVPQWMHGKPHCL
ncbi:hypothetical protein e1012e08.tmp0301 [Eimeria tenella]|uniref:Uncharacterized protein n=1 Tax=Eimeria tenella TaxID=5802 RepID=C8TDM7_EIMTE|nr:hypothetical protein e1012e08.tmp0301 [Eimeria tenella]